MRGPKYRRSLRASEYPPVPRNEVDATTTSLPAPVGGWNARDSLAAMKPTDAVVLDNIYPDTGVVRLRPGKLEYATGMSGDGESLLSYNSQTEHKLFCATNVGIYDVSFFGTVGAPETASSNAQWQSLNFANSGGSWLLAANGYDPMKLYGGSAWVDLTALSTPAVTGIDTSDIDNLCQFKHRVWMVEKNSMSAWYLDTDAIAGPATEFPMGSIFSKGGHLVAQFTWSVDGGQGLDDYLVTATSEGELAVYQGTDPDSVDTFSLVGVYYASPPIGKRCFTKYGGDILYISQQGLFPLSKLLLSATIDRTIALSDKISGAFAEATQTYGNIFGWQTTIFPNTNAIIVNVPIAESNTSYQYVMNDITKAWCRFTGWNCAAMELFQDQLFCVLGGSTFRLWVGQNDAGEPITGTCAQAYNSLGAGYQKQVKLARPNIAVEGSATLVMSFDNDFKAFDGFTELTYMSTSGSAIWDVSLWDVGTWDIGITNVESLWTTIPNEPGYLYSFRLSLTTDSAQFNWTSTNFAFSRAGIL